jgi:hypothetical protein
MTFRIRRRPVGWLAPLILALTTGIPGAHGQAPESRAGLDKCAENVPPAPTSSEITAGEICATIAVLAHDSLEGREAGLPGGDRAASYLAWRFAEIGLEPMAEGYRLGFTFPASVRTDPHAALVDESEEGAGQVDPPHAAETLTSDNIVGIVAGTDPDLRDQAVVVGAHYDHLGYGGRGSLAVGERAIHNGADDNASGVAGILELAAHFKADPTRRTIVFIMVNFDMIGRLRESLVLQGTGTSSVWPALLDSLGTAEEPEAGGVPVTRDPDGFGPSDHSSFYGADIPVLAFFTGAHEEYHRPTDDLTTIDAAGAVRVARLGARVIRAIGDRDGDIPWAEAPRTQRRAAAFKVGLGVIPDYGYPDRGLMLASVRSGGPADAAGLMAGDVLIELAGREIDDIYKYTEILGDLEPDVPVEASFIRDGETHRTTVSPAAR